jgi:membrane fusion protein (multidrug efflux system)
MHLAKAPISLLIAGAIAVGAPSATRAQPAASGPPAVGVVEAIKQPITETSEFLGRIEAVNRVNVVARVTAFLEKRLFDEGAEVKAGDELYRLERGPFEADLASKQAQVAQLQATLENAKLTTDRARTLLGGPAGQQSTYDAAIANQRSLEAQVQSAQAQVQLSQINLDYTDIRSPIDGKIGRTAVTEGNVVSPGSGVLTTIVSQDPMYVSFPVSQRELLQAQLSGKLGSRTDSVKIKIRFADGTTYKEEGTVNFVDVSVDRTTDTVLVRATIPNPDGVLIDGQLVSVAVQAGAPQEKVVVPQAALVADQQGVYVFVVEDGKAAVRRIKPAGDIGTDVIVDSGLNGGEQVIVEGIQSVKPGQPVQAAPMPAALQRG